MTEKKQAEDLENKYTDILTPILGKHIDTVEITEAAKKCALVAADQLEFQSLMTGNVYLATYWQKVKEELNG